MPDHPDSNAVKTAPSSHWTNPPGRLLNYSALLLAIVLISSAMIPAGVGWFPVIGLMGFFIIGVAWGLRVFVAVMAAAFAQSSLNDEAVQRQSVWPRWLFVPVIFGVAFVIFATRLPMRAVFFFAQPSMSRFVLTHCAAASTQSTRLPNQMIGIYPAEGIERTPWGLHFTVRGAGCFVSTGGFAYCAKGVPPKELYRNFQPLSDGWFAWTSD